MSEQNAKIFQAIGNLAGQLKADENADAALDRALNAKRHLFPTLIQEERSLLDDLRELQDRSWLDVFSRLHSEAPEIVGRYASIPISYDMALGKGLPFSLKDLLSHPDIPKDAIPLWVPPVTTPVIRLVLASTEWDLTPEGAMPPVLVLEYRREIDEETEEERITPVATGKKPEYQTAITCPHCHHSWGM